MSIWNKTGSAYIYLYICKLSEVRLCREILQKLEIMDLDECRCCWLISDYLLHSNLDVVLLNTLVYSIVCNHVQSVCRCRVIRKFCCYSWIIQSCEACHESMIRKKFVLKFYLTSALMKRVSKKHGRLCW